MNHRRGTTPLNSDDQPLFSIVKGSPTEEELAALVIVLAAAAAGAAPAPDRPGSGWSAYWRSIRAPVLPGPESWRMSSRPR